MILGAHHPALAVPDLARALGFHCGVLGFRVVMEAEIPSGVEPLDRAMRVADAGCQVRPARWAYGRDPFGNVIELLEPAPAGAMTLRFDD